MSEVEDKQENPDAIVWSNDLSVEIDELDDDHQMLIELFNHLRLAIATGESSALPWIITDLQQYLIYHFRHEEAMMEASNYAYLQNHKVVHRMMESRLESYIKNPEYHENIESAKWLMSFLQSWLKDHMQVMDKSYIDSIKGCGDLGDGGYVSYLGERRHG